MKHLTIKVPTFEITTPLVSREGKELDRAEVEKYLTRLAKGSIKKYAKFEVTEMT